MLRRFERKKERAMRSITGLAAATTMLLASQAFGAAPEPNDGNTTTPIKHVIVVIAENRTFDHVFGTYQPAPGQTVFNLLSEGIVNADGSPGPNFAKAAQFQARVTSTYAIAPAAKQAYATLPPAMTDGAPTAPSDEHWPPFATLDLALKMDPGIRPDDGNILLAGATGLPHNSLDTRIPNAASLPNGPYPLTPAISYDAYTANPAHRFFQMWQQTDCSAAHASPANPSGCLNDLFAWVEVTQGGGSNGKPPAANFDDRTTGEGSAALGFYNVAQGDAPYLKSLADAYTISDNYHQAADGGTGANHIMLGSGDMVWYSDGKGHAATPPATQIENPDPQPGSNNFYRQDGYAGGSYVACADAKQPGVAPIRDYLHALALKPNCAPGRYYLVNNYDPGYLGDGSVDTTDRFVVPPSTLPTIGDALLRKKISFTYYGEGWKAYLANPKDERYCNICDFLQYSTSIMTDPARRAAHIKDLDDFYAEIASGALPAVSFVKPSGINDGHPQSSKLDIFESFLKKLVGAVQARPDLWADTAILVTFDEGGGYWDSGYIQPLDFFGDGTRIPLIAISPFAGGGRVVHSYTDHVSILKFIEKNWSVPPITRRSRDNLPNPKPGKVNAYAPANAPAIGDLMDMFKF
jgi:phospholipase C